MNPTPLLDQVSGQLSITEGDFGNSKVDLAVANQGSNSVSILMNDGQGAFTAMPPILLSTDPNNLPSAIISGDFQGNGVVDLAVASANTDGDNVTVLLGQGEGQFDPQTPILIGSGLTPYAITALPFVPNGPLGLAIADLNSNNDLGSYSVSLLEGDDTGGFQSVAALDLGTEGAPVSITTGDFTGDGLADLAIGRSGPNSVTIELNQGGGDFARQTQSAWCRGTRPSWLISAATVCPTWPLSTERATSSFEQGMPGRAGDLRAADHDQSRLPLARYRRRRHDSGQLAGQRGRDRQCRFVVRVSRWTIQLVGTLPTGLEPRRSCRPYLNGKGEDDLIDQECRGRHAHDLHEQRHGRVSCRRSPHGRPRYLGCLRGRCQSGRPPRHPARESDLRRSRGDLEPGAAGFSTDALSRRRRTIRGVAASARPCRSLSSQDGTVGVAAAALTPGGPPDIVALNAGADTLGVSMGWETGGSPTPISLPTTGPTVVVRVADFTGRRHRRPGDPRPGWRSPSGWVTDRAVSSRGPPTMSGRIPPA